MDLNPLIDILTRAKTVHEHMLRLKKDEQAALAVGDAPALIGTATELNELADEAAALETERRQISAVIAGELGIEHPNPTLKEIVAALPSYNREELEFAGKALLDTVSVLRQQNDASAQMLERSMNALSGEVTKLAHSGDSGVYNSNGSRKAAPPLRAGLNVKV